MFRIRRRDAYNAVSIDGRMDSFVFNRCCPGDLAGNAQFLDMISWFPDGWELVWNCLPRASCHSC